MRIQNNPMAINAYNNLQGTQQAQGRSLERLSSGFRINRAADDAAGLVISESLRSQVGGLKVAKRNAQDAVSLVQTAEGALTEVHSMLQRMRDLSVQSANDTNNEKGRAAIGAEITELKTQIKNVLSGTEFNGRKLFVSQGKTDALKGTDSAAAKAALTSGAAGGGDAYLVTTAGTTPAAALQAAPVANGNIGGVAFTTTAADNDKRAIALFEGASGLNNLKVAADATGLEKGTVFIKGTNTDAANATYELHIANGGGTNSTKVTHIANRGDLEAIAEAKEGTQVALSTLVDAPKEDIKFQVGANNARTDNLTISTKDVDLFTSVYKALGEKDISVATNKDARQSVDSIDKLISSVSEVRGKLGATQNRLDHTVNSVKVSVENLTASESRIRDTDMAEEMMSLTRAQILNQAGTAMLSQANQVPQGVLSLLR